MAAVAAEPRAKKGGWARALGKAPVALVAVASLAVAAWAGLVRIGWEWAMPLEDLPPMHGALMVCGFLGTVIGIERAVALNRWWAWVAPAAFAAGAIALVAGLPGALDWSPKVPRAFFAAASVALAAETILIATRQRALFTAVMAAGTLALAAGNTLWLRGLPLFQVVPWWMGFLVLTIASERLELSRVLNLKRRAVLVFALETAGLLVALAWSARQYTQGLRAAGVVFVLLALWMLRCDVARRTIRMAGLTRFVAAGLLAGYAWLALGGALMAWNASAFTPFIRDAAYHAVFLGFVMSMIFAHAPIIVPAVTGAGVKWSPSFYLPLALLHGTLAARVAADLTLSLTAREWAALGNAVSILLFIAVLAVAAIRAALEKRRQGRAPRAADVTRAATSSA